MTRYVGSFDQVGTPFEAAHLSGDPHATFSYGTPRQDSVAIDTVAQ
jgi:hypothetical protein